MMSDSEYAPNARTVYLRELEEELAPEVWKCLAGNGTLRLRVDTDVDCSGEWQPHECDDVAYAQSWVAYFVRSTLNRLADKDLLNVPEEGT